MKTKEQILEWLDKQLWKNEFYEEFFKNGNGMIFWGKDFILRALDYEHKVIDLELWEERNEDFNDWYNTTDKPMSWEEYCEQNPITKHDWCIAESCLVTQCAPNRRKNSVYDASAMSKELCEAFVAYMKLIRLRNAWVKKYDYMNMRYRVIARNGDIKVNDIPYNVRGLSFADEETAREFISTFKDLLEIAKPLI